MDDELPFQAETIPAATARFSAALTTEWDGDAIVSGAESDRPGRHREHVFDFCRARNPKSVELWRTIVSLERHRAFGKVIHFSARLINARPNDLALFGGTAFGIFAFISDVEGTELVAKHSFFAGDVAHLMFDPSLVERIKRGR